MTKKPKKLREDEEAVRTRLAAILGTKIEQLDDGHQNSLPDLKIVYPDGKNASIEVTSDRNRQRMAAIHDNGFSPWTATTLNANWTLISQGQLPTWKKLRNEVEPLLRRLQDAGIDDFHHGIEKSYQIKAATTGSEPETSVWRSLLRLRQLHVQQGRTSRAKADAPPYTIEVALGFGGSWDRTADAVSAWVTDFVNDPDRIDNVRKLDSGGAESHIAIHVSFDGAGINVARGVNDDYHEGILPACDPDLPVTITDLWLSTSFETNDVLRWTRGNGWIRYARLNDAS